MVPEPTRILFVGNSLIFAGGGVDLAFQKIAEQAGKQLTVDRQTVGGMRLAEHASRPETLDAICSGRYDTVILQEQSNAPLTEREAFHAAVRKLVPVVRESGAQPWLYATWTYKQTFRDIDPANGRMTAGLAEAYEAIGQELDVPVMPCGRVWQRALDETDLELYEDLHHQNETGAYLVACVLFRTLYGESLEGLGNGPAAELVERAMQDFTAR